MKKLIFIIFLNGCFFGIFQRPKTIGEGNIDFSVGSSFQFAPNPYDREKIEERGYYLFPNIALDFSYGVLNGFDIGFHFSGAGLGPFIRFDVYKKKVRKVEQEFLIAPYLLYDPLISQSLALRLDAIYSWTISKYFEPFVFYQAYYNPYFDEFAENKLGAKPVGNIGSGYYHFFGGGAGINWYIQKKRKLELPDIRFNFEIGLVPVRIASENKIIPVFNFGLGAGGIGLFSCYKEKETFYREFCPGDIIMNIIYLIFGLGS